jgi:thiol-disulfide isomerase/thioredoxin
MQKTLLITAMVVSSFLLVGCGQKSTEDTATKPNVEVQKSANPQTAALASCLTEKKFTMYGTEWCPHCKSQKDLFGADFSKVPYVDCDKEAAKCTEAKITGYPTWKGTDGKAYPGTQQLDMLAQYAGCTN